MPSTLTGLRFGDLLDGVSHVAVEVKNSSTLLVPENPKRRYLYLANDSDTVVYVARGVPARLNFGMRLEANGGILDFAQDKSNLCCHAIYAIHSKTNPKRVLVTEGW